MEENISQQQSEIPQTFPASVSNSGWKPKLPLVSVVLLLLVIVGTTGFFLGKSLSQPKTSPPPVSQVSPSPTPTPENPISTPTPDPTANWKTYRNEEYGFEVKYPLDFSVKEEAATTILESKKWNNYQGNHPFIEISAEKTISSPLEWLDKNQIYGPLIRDTEGKIFINSGGAGEQVKEPVEPTTIDGKEAWKFYWWGVSGGGDHVLVKNKSFLYHISRHLAGALENPEETVPKNLFDLILSTFKFLD